MRNRWIAAMLGSALGFPLAAQPLTGSNGNAQYSYPQVIYGQPQLTYKYQFSAHALPGTSDDTIGLSCSGAGITCSVDHAFLPLSSTGSVFNVSILAAIPGNYQVNMLFLSGKNGGADDPVVQLTTNFITDYLPTWDATSADWAGDPISTATGELYGAVAPDLSLGGPLPIVFQRYYASQILANGLSTRMGTNWMHSFEWLLSLSGNQAIVTRIGAKTITFNKSGTSWTLANAEQYGYQLVTVNSTTYQFLDPRTKLIYTFSGTATTLGNTSIQDRNGNTLTITLPANGSSQVSDGLGRILFLNYDPGSGLLVQVADQTGRSVSFGYTGSNLTQFTDANGKTTTYSYISAGTETGLLTSIALPLGNKPQSQTWDQYARVATQSDSRGNTATMNYDQPLGSTAYKDALGAIMTDTSANYSTFLTYTDPDKQTLSVTYDANGHRNSATDRLGNKISLTFQSPSGYLASATDALGNTTTYTWVAQTSGAFTYYVLGKVQYADGSSTSDAYDANGNLLTFTDQAGKIWKYAYNARGQRVTATDPLGRVTRNIYNPPDGTLASVTDAAGNITTYGYDSLKRRNMTTYADGATTSNTFDGVGNTVSTIQGTGTATIYNFNDNEKLQSTTRASGQPSTVTYDTDEHILKITDSTGAATSFTYNQVGLNNSMITPAGETFTDTFDSHRRLSGVFDPAGNGATIAYDKEDGLASVTDALSRKTSYTTDAFGSVIKITTPMGESYTSARDQRNRLTSVADPSGITASATLDQRGLPSALTIGNLSSTVAHDDSGRITGITDPNGNTWAFGIDSAGRTAMRTDPLNRTTTASFDKRNRVAGFQFPAGSVAYTRDSSGDILQSLYSDGTTLNFTYSGRSLATGPGLAFTYNSDHRITGSNGLAIGRDPDGRILSITYGPGKMVTYGYNSVGLVSTVTDWLGGMSTFTYDAAHELVAIMRPNGLGTQYTHDADGRIASITEDAGSSITIVRDAAGKTLSETRTNLPAPEIAPGVLPLAFDAADQVSGFTYDALGRITKDAFRTYGWDLASRLTSYSGVDGAATSTYDGLGMRISETTSAGPRNFIWNYATSRPSLAVERDPSGDRRYNVYLPSGSLLYAIDAPTGARHYYHFDQYGSTTALSNDAGAVTDSYGISPYGETVTQIGSTENPFTWLGQWGVRQEGSTSLYSMGSRIYDSTTNRFLSPSPILSTSPQKINPYTFALSNPLGFTGSAPRQGPFRYERTRREPPGHDAGKIELRLGELTERPKPTIVLLGTSPPLMPDSQPSPGYNPASDCKDGGSSPGDNGGNDSPEPRVYDLSPADQFDEFLWELFGWDFSPEGPRGGCWVDIQTGSVLGHKPTTADLFGGKYYFYEDPCTRP